MRKIVLMFTLVFGTAALAAAQKIETVTGEAVLSVDGASLVLAVDTDLDGSPDAEFVLDTGGPVADVAASGSVRIEFWRDGLAAHFLDQQTLVMWSVENAARPVLAKWDRRPLSKWESSSFERLAVRRFKGLSLVSRSGPAVGVMWVPYLPALPSPTPPGGTCASSCSVSCAKGTCSVSCASGYCAQCNCDLSGWPTCTCSF
jgi:hypothetical protein